MPFIAVAVLLELAAGTGLTYVAGFDNVRAAAGRFDGFWLFVLVGALLISIVGYYFAYQGIFRVEDGPRLHGVLAIGYYPRTANGKHSLTSTTLHRNASLLA